MLIGFTIMISNLLDLSVLHDNTAHTHKLSKVKGVTSSIRCTSLWQQSTFVSDMPKSCCLSNPGALTRSPPGRSVWASLTLFIHATETNWIRKHFKIEKNSHHPYPGVSTRSCLEQHHIWIALVSCYFCRDILTCIYQQSFVLFELISANSLFCA